MVQQLINLIMQLWPARSVEEHLSRSQKLLSLLLAATTLVGATFNSLGSTDNALLDPEQPRLEELTQALDTSRVWEDNQTRNDIATILNHSRINAGRTPLDPNYDLGLHAQRWAERNATTDSFKQTPENVVMVQSMLPYADAKAARFLDGWFADAASQQALAGDNLSQIGVGIASAGGKTYAVIQLR